MSLGLIEICLMLTGLIVGMAIQALTTTHKERKQVMADINTLIALAKENNEQAKKIRGEVIGMRDKLNERIAALEEQIGNLNVTPEQLAALEAELTGAKAVIAEIDELNPDAPAPEPTPEPTPENQ